MTPPPPPELAPAHLLSPYRPSGAYPSSLSGDDAAAWLSGLFALWHPAALLGRTGAPQITPAYDHDEPLPDTLYAVPESPPAYQPDTWGHAVTAANSHAFSATADRVQTLANLRAALSPGRPDLGAYWDLPGELVAAFGGVGLAHLVIDGLFDAASHDRLLDEAGFWADVSEAAEKATDADAALAALGRAATRLQDARESLHPGRVAWVHRLDLGDWLTAETLPGVLRAGLPAAVAATGAELERFAAAQPELFARLKSISDIEFASTGQSTRDEALLPLSAQLDNLARGAATVEKLVGVRPETFVALSPVEHHLTPSLLNQAGFRYIYLNTAGERRLPGHDIAVVNWPAPDGRTVDGTGRVPVDAGDPCAVFNLTSTLHTITRNDTAPLLVWRHAGPDAAGMSELAALLKLGGALGEAETVRGYLGSHHYGEYLGTTTPEDFAADLLTPRATRPGAADPVSALGRYRRDSQRIGAAQALLALYQTLSPAGPREAELAAELEALSEELDAGAPDSAVDAARLAAAEAGAAETLAARLSLRGAPGMPGYLVFNASAVPRRVSLELAGAGAPSLAPGSVSPVKALDAAGDLTRLVVEVPGLGFTWLSRGAPAPAVTPGRARPKTAEGNLVRNEFFEAELDPATGGLKALRDLRTRLNRLGAQVVHSGGSRSVAKRVWVSADGPALGEVNSEGHIEDDFGAALADFTLTLRATPARPALELAVTIRPHAPAVGLPWFNATGLRFAWRDPRTALYRGQFHAPHLTNAREFAAPDYAELRLGAERTALLCGGLGFWRRHQERMLDWILQPPAETATRFEMVVLLDRDYLASPADAWTAPVPVVATESGPPGGMVSGSLAHLDLPTLHLLRLKPLAGKRGLSARFLETAQYAGGAAWTFAQPIAGATLADAAGTPGSALATDGGRVDFDFSAGELFQAELTWE